MPDVGFRLLAGRQRPPQATDLHLLSGIVSGLPAKASHDLGDPGSAMTQARAAYVCAGLPGFSTARQLQHAADALVAVPEQQSAARKPLPGKLSRPTISYPRTSAASATRPAPGVTWR